MLGYKTYYGTVFCTELVWCSVATFKQQNEHKSCVLKYYIDITVCAHATIFYVVQTLQDETKFHVKILLVYCEV